MSRSDYSDDLDQWAIIRWRGAVAQAIRGKRGQRFLLDLKSALEELPKKQLQRNVVVKNGEVCAIGALVKKQDGVTNAFEKEIEEETIAEALSKKFDVSQAIVREIMFENDERCQWQDPMDRYKRMLAWVSEQIKKENA